MVIRINGTSGIDVDSLVKSMMTAKRVPLDKLNQDKQILNWTRESYRDMNSKLFDFRQNKLLTKYGTNSAMTAQKSVTTGNTDALKAEATASANGIAMEVSISQLATKTNVQTTGAVAGTTSASTLAQLQASLDGTDPTADTAKAKEFKLKVNNVSFTFKGSDGIGSIISTINANSTANVTASFDEITGKLTISSKTSGPTGTVVLGATAGDNSVLELFSKKTVINTTGAGTGFSSATTLANLQNSLDGTTVDASKEYKLVINGKTFTFDATKSMSDITSTITADATANTTATFDDTTGKLTLTSKTAAAISLGSGSNDLMKLFKGVVSTDPGVIAPTVGISALININGTDMVKDSNSFIVNGVQMDLLTTTTATGIPVKITTSADPTKTLETIKGFVEDYNTLITTLNAKVDEAKYRDFAPLTDEQKADMKEADITTWTTKAQSGLLKNNDILKSVLSEMRAIITDKLGPLSTLGITTGTWGENGKIKIVDEDKLKKAISDNPQMAMDLFQGPASAPKEGILDKMAVSVASALDKIALRAGTNKYSMELSSSYNSESVMGKKLTSYNTRIATMQTNLDNLETRYYKQFTAMETAMNKLSTQSASLFSS